MMIKPLRNLLRAFCKEHGTTQIKLHKSKLLVYDEFLKKYVSIDELLIPREVYKEKDDITLLRKKSRDLLLFDLLLKKFVNPKLDLLTPGFKDQLPNVFRIIKHDNTTCKSGKQYFWKKKKEGTKNHNIPALPPVHDTKSNNKESNSPRFGWAGQPTRSPESDPRPELSNTTCNVNPNKDPKRSKPSKLKKLNKQLKVCGKQKQEKKDPVEKLKPVVLQEDECYHIQKRKSGLKIYSKSSLNPFKDKSLRPFQKEKFNVLEICAQLFAGRKCEVKEKVHEKSNKVTKKEIEKKANKNAILENKQINKFVQESNKINNIGIDSEAETTLNKCSNEISKTPKKTQFNKEIGTKGNTHDLNKTVISVNSTRLCDTSENIHSKNKIIKHKGTCSCSHKLDKQVYCKSSCKLENCDSKVDVVNSKESLNGTSLRVVSDITANKPIESDCKKNLPEETKLICRQLTSKNKGNELLVGNDPEKNCNLKNATYNFMVIPKSMKYSPSLKPSLKIKIDNYFNGDINSNLKATPKFTDEKSIKTTHSKTTNSEGNKCLNNEQTTKAKDQRSGNKDIFSNQEQTCITKNQIVKAIASVPDLSFKPSMKQHRKEKKISSSKIICWKGLEFGLKKPNDNPKKQCKKTQETLTTLNKNNSMAKSQCLHIEPTVSERLESITQLRSFYEVDHCKDFSKHKSDKYMGFKIKKTCDEKKKSQQSVNSCTKISKTKSGQSETAKTECNKRNIKTKTKIAKKNKTKDKCIESKKKKCLTKYIKSYQYLTENKEDDYARDSKHLSKSVCFKNNKETEESPRTNCKTLHSKSLQRMNENVGEDEFPCGNVNFINSCDEHKSSTKEVCTTGKEDLVTNEDCKSTDSALLVSEVKDLCSTEPAKSDGKYSAKVNIGKDKLSYNKKKGKHHFKKRCTSVIATVQVSKTKQNKSEISGTITKNKLEENIITKGNPKRAKSCKSLKTPRKLYKSMSALICPKTSVKSAQYTTKFKNQSILSAKKSSKERTNNKDSFTDTNSNCGKDLTETQRNSSKSQTSKTSQKTSQSPERVEKKAYGPKISRSSSYVIQNKTANICSLQTHKNKTKEDPFYSNIIRVKSVSKLKSINYLQSNNNKTKDFILKEPSCNKELQVIIPQTPETAKVLFYETSNNKNNSSNLNDKAILKHKVEWYIKSPINYLQESALKAGEPKQNGTLTLNSIKYKHDQGIHTVRKRGTVMQNEEKEPLKLKTLYTIPNVPDTNSKKHKIEHLDKNKVFTDTFLKDNTLLYNGNKLKDKLNRTKVEDSKIFQNSNQNDRGLNTNTQPNNIQINHLQNLVNYTDKVPRECEADDTNIVSNTDHKAYDLNTQPENSSNSVTEVGPNARQLNQQSKNNQITHTLMKTTRVSEKNERSKECLRGTNKISAYKINTQTQNGKCGPLHSNKCSPNEISRQNWSGEKSTNTDTKHKSSPLTNLNKNQNNKSLIKTFKMNLDYKSRSAETRAANTQLPFFLDVNYYKNEVAGVKTGIKKYKVQTTDMKSSIQQYPTTNIVTNNYTNSNKFDEKVNFSRPKTSHVFSNPNKNKVQDKDNLIKYSETSLIDLKSTNQQKVNLKEKSINSSMKNKNKARAISNERKNKVGAEDTNKINLDNLKNDQQGSLVAGKTFVVDKRLRKIAKKNPEFNKNIVKRNGFEDQERNATGKNSNASNVSNKIVHKTVLKEIDCLVRGSDKPPKERTIVVIKNKANTPITGRQNDKESANSKGSLVKETVHSNKFGKTTGKSKNDCISDINGRIKADLVAHQSSLNKYNNYKNLNLKAGYESGISTPCQFKKIPATK